MSSRKQLMRYPPGVKRSGASKEEIRKRIANAMKFWRLKDMKEPFKILLVNEKVRFTHKLPAIGLAILADIAKQEGHKVKVIDYQLTPNAPSLEDYIRHLKPDVVGFRIVNESWHTVSKKIDQIRPMVRMIIIGGPYPSLHHKELSKDDRIDSVFIGEAEDSFKWFLAHLKHKKPTDIYKQSPTDPDTIPIPDFTTFHNYKTIQHYPLQLSRGCPYDCSFCTTKLINSRRWRKRFINNTMGEIILANRRYKNLTRIVVIDDNPTVDIKRFTTFLKLYYALYNYEPYYRPRLPSLGILNIRADRINSEIGTLLRKCRVKKLLIGIESVGKLSKQLMKKNVTIQNIKNAKKILNANEIMVGGTFIIGLPGDDWKNINKTIKFAQDLDLKENCWGCLIPFKGTRVRKDVKVLNDYAITMVAPQGGKILSGTASETKHLPERWQIKLWLRANIKTNPQTIYPTRRYMPRYILYSVKYGEIHNLLKHWLKYRLRHRLKYRQIRTRDLKRATLELTAFTSLILALLAWFQHVFYNTDKRLAMITIALLMLIGGASQTIILYRDLKLRSETK